MLFYQDVPKGLEENLRYRIALREAARDDVRVQSAIRAACRNDTLFFFNAFCWIFEPRLKTVAGIQRSKILPFITWPNQDEMIRTVRPLLGYEDVGVGKTRGEGASWIAVGFSVQDFLFERMSTVGFVSMNEKAADDPDNPDSLFWKWDFMMSKLPRWLRPVIKKNQENHTRRNMSNGATTVSFAATGDVASGGRKSWFLMDELGKFPRGPDKEAMASTQHVTNSRLIVSTPKGTEGAYAAAMRGDSNMTKVFLRWQDNPTKNRGLYRYVNGRPVALDPINNPLPLDYEENSKPVIARLRSRGFKIEDKDRSPWYDRECDRANATPLSIAQELDLSFGGSVSRVFGDDFFRVIEHSQREPLVKGILSFHPETLEPDFDTSDTGGFRLWLSLDSKRRPPRHRYVLGADVCTGGGGAHTSNSVIEVIDLTTMEQVMEWATNTVEPSDFADTMVAVAKWFHGAYIAWEHNGPGTGCTKRIRDSGYSNVYQRTVLHRRSKKRTKELGWWTDEKTKEAMFNDFSRTVRTTGLVIHSKELVRECGDYIRVSGKIENSLVSTTDDESAKGVSHGDRVIAMCVALQAAMDRPLNAEEASETNNDEIPLGTLAARNRDYEESLRQKEDYWDGRSNNDLASGRRW